MLDYIRILRPINIVLVIIIQAVLYFAFLKPVLLRNGIEPLLDNNLAWIMIAITTLAAGAGYIINDIKDYRADLINKPDQTFVGIGHISIPHAWTYYTILILIGLWGSLYIMVVTGNYKFWWIYPIINLLLFLYSICLKRLPILGNLIVSVFSFLIPGIFFFAERDGIFSLKGTEDYLVMKCVMIAYLSFSFLATFVREVVKDIEDMEGDMQQNFYTLPVAVGMDSTKGFSYIIFALLFASYYYWMDMFSYHEQAFLYKLIFFSLIIIPTIYIVAILVVAYEKADFTLISRYLKMLMSVSIILFLFFVSTY